MTPDAPASSYSSPAQPATLLDWLAIRYPSAKRQTLRRMLQAGRVTVDGRVARRAGQPLEERSSVSVADRPVAVRTGPASDLSAKASRDPRLRIVYEDDDVL